MKRTLFVVVVAILTFGVAPAPASATRPTKNPVTVSLTETTTSDCTFTATANWPSTLSPTKVGLSLLGSSGTWVGRHFVVQGTSANYVWATISGDSATASWTTATRATSYGFSATATLYDATDQVITSATSTSSFYFCETPPTN